MGIGAAKTVEVGKKFSYILHKVLNLSEVFGKKVQTEEWERALASITWESQCRNYNRQRSCLHRKGGKYAPLTSVRDYAVTEHLFIDGRTRIKCALCGIEAWSRSGEDYKFAYMSEMAESSTNARSASEQPLLGVVIGGKVVEAFNNIPGVSEKIKAKYPLWDGAIKPRYAHRDDCDITVFVDENSVYDTPKEKFTDIGEDTNPIKGIQPATQFDTEDRTILL